VPSKEKRISINARSKRALTTCRSASERVQKKGKRAQKGVAYKKMVRQDSGKKKRSAEEEERVRVFEEVPYKQKTLRYGTTLTGGFGADSGTDKRKW